MRAPWILSTPKVVLGPARLARSLVTVLVLTLLQTIGSPLLAPSILTPESSGITLNENLNKFLQWNSWGDQNNHHPYFSTGTSFITSNSDTIQLTTEGNSQTGYIWNTDVISSDFSVTADYYFGGRDGADGVGFVIRQLSDFPNGGTSSGSGNSHNRSPRNSLKIWFDTYQNGSEINDDHLSVYHNNSLGQETIYGGNGVSLSGTNAGDIEDGQWWTYTIKWDANLDKVFIYKGALGASQSEVASYAISGFELTSYSWGFIGETGGANNNQAVRNVHYNYPAIVTGHPQDVVATVGDSVSFSTTYTNVDLAPSTRWWESSDNGGTWSEIYGATAPTYSFVASRSMTQKRYRYSIANTAANHQYTTYSNSALLTVNPLPLGRESDTALSFDGTSQYASAPDHAVFDIRDSISIEAWVNPSAIISGKWNFVVNKESAYQLGISTSGKWAYSFNGDVNAVGISTGIPVKTNEWHHIAITRLAGTDEVKFYYDGYLAYKGTADGAGTGQISDAATAFSIGRRASDGRYFQGQIDHVALFDTARSADNIKADMSGYISPTTSGLRAYYDFNEGTDSGSTLYNRKSGAISSTDLSITGSPRWPHVADESVISTAPYTVVKFPRTYITVNGGWKVPSNVSRATVIIVGGGGGGGGGDSSANSGGPSGGGGGGGVTYVPTQTLTPNATIEVRVGMGGIGGKGGTPLDDAVTRSGQATVFGSSTALGGGGGGSHLTGARGAGSGINDTSIATGGGSSGAGWSGDGCSGQNLAGGIVSSGFNAGYGVWGWGGSGGGARGAATNGGCWPSPNSGSPGPGFIDPITSIEYGRGGYSDASMAITASHLNLANRGFGGSSQYNSGNANGDGYGGSAGTVIIRWITAQKPTYTKPTNAYLNLGMTETFTTNVAQDSATAVLTRTFKWESTTPAANGSYTLIKQGTGAANAAFSWVPTDTATSGSGYLYRLTVTDSDTAGLFIIDSSTAYAVINRALVASGNRSISKTVNINKSESFTISLGTGPYQISWTRLQSQVNMETTTASTILLRVSDTATIGTYFETITVIDSVSAVLQIPITINVVPPPSFLHESELINTDLVLDYEFGSSQSLLGQNGVSTTGLTLRDISGGGNHAITGSGGTNLVGDALECSAPTYSNSNGGSALFGSTKCFYSPFKSQELGTNFSVSVWFKATGNLRNESGLISQLYADNGYNISFFIGSVVNGNSLTFGVMDGTIYTTTGCPYTPIINKWTQVTGTYDGQLLSMYIDGALMCSEVYTGGYSGTTNTRGLVIGKGWRGYAVDAFPGSIASVRVYKSALSAATIATNYDATKPRFNEVNNYLVDINKKYGSLIEESFTVTAGTDTKTVSYAIGTQTGIIWDTSTAISTLKLALQESSTIGTYYETLTVVDGNGSSTYLPLRLTVSKADTLTVTMGSPTFAAYNGLPITAYPRPTIQGLVWQDTATASSRFTSLTYSDSPTVPTNADTYTVRGSVPMFTRGTLDNYQGIVYETSTATINKINQRPLGIFLYGGTVGLPYLIWLQGGNGTGEVSETLTGVSTLSGCSISNHYLSAVEQKQGFCEVQVVKAGDQNYFSETQTAQMYFMAYINNQPTGQVGSGTTIAINGVTSFETSTVTPPSITSFNLASVAVGGEIEINGSGFSQPGLVIKFNRNKIAATPSSPTDSKITVTIPSGASSGRVVVITQNGEAVSSQSLVITP